jgi:hypothetical protein
MTSLYEDAPVQIGMSAAYSCLRTRDIAINVGMSGEEIVTENADGKRMVDAPQLSLIAPQIRGL